MTAQILTSELSNLIQDSKRKHPDLRNVSIKDQFKLSINADTWSEGGREVTAGPQVIVGDIGGSTVFW